ncbi:regulator [Halalkalibacillus sediminis]|uniref:Regulator n=1 Tax=Halalkalibacillus sediminis TaxID=2018042 RepID=A0A2I0QVZ5_9BACI|nr:YlbF family regulator [Halalkalibacillus sediminis]PKR78512.1 regulator [Halalkalibacillus sediminis]
MLANIEVIEVLEQAEKLGKMIKKSDDFEAYQSHQAELYSDGQAKKLVDDFTNMKDQYEDVQRFGRYHPDYYKIMKEIRTTKREMDMNDFVASYRQSETKLQELLDDVSEIIAHEISPSVKVPREGLALKDSGCGCGSGGGCGCAS